MFELSNDFTSSLYITMYDFQRIYSDHIKHWTDSRHIAVYHQGRWFKVFCYKNGQLLNAKEFERVFDNIINDTSEPCKGEKELAALTAGNRRPWAEVKDL